MAPWQGYWQARRNGRRHTGNPIVFGKQAHGLHRCYTKLKGKQKSFSSKTKVYFSQLNNSDIFKYVETCKPYDKAGAYGIQEWIGYIGINQIKGSFYNVMGLPTALLYKELTAFIDGGLY
ncbi:MAG: hypothetical protein HC896_17400 [Bacteroidales bacterium]|nr:hypothetical protein [Bacteroidales bacterium]